jgi:hypothetical protein
MLEMEMAAMEVAFLRFLPEIISHFLPFAEFIMAISEVPAGVPPGGVPEMR